MRIISVPCTLLACTLAACRDRVAVDHVEIPGIGRFERSDSAPYNFTHQGTFRGSAVRYVIYPTDATGMPVLSPVQLAAKFELYHAKWQTSLRAAMPLIRKLCADYGFSLVGVSDDALLEPIRPRNIKYENEGFFESYCDPGKALSNFDLVLRFDAHMVPINAYFDG